MDEKQEPGVHLLYIPPDVGDDDRGLANTELLVCDECFPLEEGQEVTLLRGDMEGRLLAEVGINAEARQHMCGDHRHAACAHIYGLLQPSAE